MASEPVSEARPNDSTPVSPVVGPVRTCVGCRQRAAKSELLRVIAGSGTDGRPAFLPDPAARAHGRGAHLHPTSECYQLAVRRKAFARALRLQGTGPISSAPLDAYLEQIQNQHTSDRSPDKDWSPSS